MGVAPFMETSIYSPYCQRKCIPAIIIAMVVIRRAMPAGTTNMGVLRRRFQCSNCRTAKLTISPISPGEWAGCHQQYDMVVLKISTLYRKYQGIAVGQTVKPYNPSWLVVWNMNGLL